MSPDFGKKPLESLDYHELLKEIDKRKQNLNLIKASLGAEDLGPKKTERKSVAAARHAAAGSKLKQAIKRLQVKHLQDLFPIKKPLPFVMKACQLFCLLNFSLKRDFNPRSAVHVFTDWSDIHKYIVGSTKMF